jgi:hypothetical protein
VGVRKAGVRSQESEGLAVRCQLSAVSQPPAGSCLLIAEGWKPVFLFRLLTSDS